MAMLAFGLLAPSAALGQFALPAGPDDPPPRPSPPPRTPSPPRAPSTPSPEPSTPSDSPSDPTSTSSAEPDVPTDAERRAEARAAAAAAAREKARIAAAKLRAQRAAAAAAAVRRREILAAQAKAAERRAAAAAAAAGRIPKYAAHTDSSGPSAMRGVAMVLLGLMAMLTAALAALPSLNVDNRHVRRAEVLLLDHRLELVAVSVGSVALLVLYQALL